VAVSGLPANTTLAGGEDFTCGLTPAGEVYCWGDNAYGQLGQGTIARELVPTVVNLP
jgi:alpha-tubulin suppressor-like RCC1 family protein